ncbi:radial spoke head 10 homolog B-like isoform X1 [Frieseomelitta varia]|nr:radial spoke head 10 homolog B-like isoform X1 [Frieseomelitta varia]
MNEMNGIGLRIYPSGARYVGQWKNGVRDGVGTMVWSNRNLYRGEWKCGAMNGYGEYVWNGFFNKTFTWPQEASYIGHWRHGMRHGKGEIKLNSVGGAKYSGYWKDNKKHGYGIIIGSNGEKFEFDPLFLNDILYAPNVVADNLENEIETKNEKECVRTVKEIKPLFIEKPDQLTETLATPILKPEQFLDLFYYIARLLDPKSLEPSLVLSTSSGKCYSCENESCSCLTHSVSIDATTSEENDISQTNASKEMIDSNWRYEERWTYSCLMFHMFRLRQIYNDYAKLFAKSAPKCNLAMSKLCLWQLWRDCGIHEKGFSLVEIDSYIAKNEITGIKDPHHPFEKIEIWQFLHALLETSWHLYTKHNDIEIEEMNGKLAGGLHRFLKNDVYPHAGNHIGSLCYENQDLLPIYCVFELYQQIGYPPSARDLLRATCNLKGTADSSTTVEAMKNFPDGINFVTVGEKVSYLLKLDDIFVLRNCMINVSRKNENNLYTNELLVFGQLGISKITEIMTLICPGIKDASSGIIINMDYKLTFLEFYEIILEATKELLSLKKKTVKLLHMKKIEEEVASFKTNNLQRRDDSQVSEQSSIKKISKIKKGTLI